MNPQASHMFGYGPHYAQTISRGSNLQQIYAPGQLATMDPHQQLARPNGYYVEPAGCQPYESLAGLFERQAALNRPLCRCRVMYLGSSVPHITKNGLHGIQEPLRHLYPEEQFHGGAQTANLAPAGSKLSQTIDISHLSSGLGIDSWLSVWSNGILLQNVDEFGREIRRFFSIESLHYCAAVRYFDTAQLKTKHSQSESVSHEEEEEESQIKVIEQDQNNNNTNDNNSEDKQPGKGPVRFLPLDAPLFRWPGMLDPSHPPVFASIMRRTTGIKVLECHAFICRRDAAANALVRCCTHAYGDFLSAKRLSMELAGGPRTLSSSMTLGRYQGGQRRRARIPSNQPAPLQPASSAGLTAASSNGEESHSLDQSNSSEDNYAIISKPSAAKDSATRRRAGERKVRGSSRSLFTDFMPSELETAAKPEEPGQPQGRLDKCASGRLSRSSDQLADLCRLECCSTLTKQRRPAAEEQYSVVRNKRHSRSMQNLENPAECKPEGRPARSAEPGASRRTNSKTDKARKAASYQDMRRESSELAPASSNLHQRRRGASQADSGSQAAPSGARSRRRHARRDCCPRDSSQHHLMQTTPIHHHMGAFYPSCCPPAPAVGQPIYASTAAYHLPAYYVPGPQLYGPPGQLASPIYVEPPGLPGASKHNIARFRCLSPPANLLSDVALQKPQQQPVGRPAPPDAAKTAKSRRVSWIKRLSLTLSSASGSGSIQMEPDASQEFGRQQPASKPKRSSLFAGSLTLGRSRQHAKLTSPAGPSA